MPTILFVLLAVMVIGLIWMTITENRSQRRH